MNAPFPSPEAAELARSKKLSIYAAGPGVVIHWSGIRLGREAAMLTLASHLATAKSMTAPEGHVRHAHRCIADLTAALEASFPDQQEPQ